MTKARILANTADALSATSSTELGYLDGVTSDIQTQLNAKQAGNANVSSTELGYLDGVTSAIQTQLNAKQAIVSGVNDTEIGYLDGVTSAIQTQLNAKAPTASPTFTGNVTVGGTPPTTGAVNAVGSNGGIALALSDNVNSSLYVRNVSGGSTIGTDSGGAIHLASNGNTASERRLSINAAGATTVAYTTTTGGAVRNIYMSTSDPSGGSDGDVWIKYTA